MAVDYIPFWTDTLAQQESMMHSAAKTKEGQKKIVFTKTLDKSVWENTALAKGNLSEEGNKLKNQRGKDIIVYVFTSLRKVREKAEEWRQDYNAERPHKSLGYAPPEEYQKIQIPMFKPKENN